MTTDSATGSAVQPVAGVDLDDMFGLRRALRLLPERRWDDFFSAWARIAETCELDVERMQAMVAWAAGALDRYAATDDELSAAWETVSAAMRAYLGWREQRVQSWTAVFTTSGACSPGTLDPGVPPSRVVR